MNRLTFGISASAFIANMCIKQNTMDYAGAFSLAAVVVDDTLCVDDDLTGAESIEEAIELYKQLQLKGGFVLRKWNLSNPEVLKHIDPELRANQSTHSIVSSNEYTNTRWNSREDEFNLSVTKFVNIDVFTKCVLLM